MRIDDKNRILELRDSGASLRQIAKKLEMSLSVVHDFLLANAQVSFYSTCPVCQKTIIHYKQSGRHRIYCSDKCRFSPVARKKIYVYAFFVTNLSRHIATQTPNFAHISATRGTVMRSNYRRRVHHYLVSRSFYESLLQDALLTTSEYKQINAELLAKYGLDNRSIFNDE